jgi:hypothetical protein
MQGKVTVLFVSIALAFCFVSCKDDSGSKSDTEICNDFCDKAYDECADEYADESGLSDSEVEDLLDICHDGCEPDQDAEDCAACTEDAYSEAGLDDCIYTIDSSAYNNCVMDLSCDDFASGDGCEDEYDDMISETEDNADACADAQADLDEDELADWNDALTACAEDECSYLYE